MLRQARPSMTRTSNASTTRALRNFTKDRKVGQFLQSSHVMLILTPRRMEMLQAASPDLR